MPYCRKRTVLFFCIFVLGVGGCLDNLAMAGSHKTFIPGILKEFAKLRVISGYVTYNGNGLDNVGIYDGNTLLAVTNSVGFYKAEITQGLPTTLTPRKTGFQFSPPSRVIPEDQYDHPNQNFTAQSTVPLATISGTVVWKNSSGNTTIPTNPLPMVAMEAYAQEGSLYSRVVTGTDGYYSIDVPVGWTGRVQPFRQGFGFIPEKTPYSNLSHNQVQNYQAPFGSMYRITVSIKQPNGQKLPLTVHARVYYDGIDHANGSRDVSELYRDSGETYFDFYSGWIGEIKPNIYAGGTYTLNPPSIRMSAPITTNMTFSFTATPK